MDMNKLRKLGGIDQVTESEVITEADQYKGSEEFMDDMADVYTILNSKRWEQWMKDTDSNFGTKNIHKDAMKIKKMIRKLSDDLDKAGE